MRYTLSQEEKAAAKLLDKWRCKIRNNAMAEISRKNGSVTLRCIDDDCEYSECYKSSFTLKVHKQSK